jgi:hypothetical protein
MKISKSIYFKDTQGKKYFLFQVVNYGKKDDLKFIFNAKDQGTGIIYSPDGSFTSKQDVIRPYTEITYHNDGNLQDKLQTNSPYKEGDDRIKKAPLNQIDDWEPIIKYNVVDYSLCRKKEPSDVIFLPENNEIFNGDPFECIFCLIHMKYMTPSTDETDDIIFRINDVAKNIDLLLFIRKSSYRGKLITIPNTNITVLNKGNVVTKVERNKSAQL